MIRFVKFLPIYERQAHASHVISQVASQLCHEMRTKYWMQISTVLKDDLKRDEALGTVERLEEEIKKKRALKDEMESDCKGIARIFREVSGTNAERQTERQNRIRQ